MNSGKIILLGGFLILITSMVNAQKLDEFDKKASGESESSENAKTSSDCEEIEEVDIEFEIEDIESAAYAAETTCDIFNALINITSGLLFYFPEAEGDIQSIRYTKYPYADGHSGIFLSQGTKQYALKANYRQFRMNRDLTGFGLSAHASPHPYIDFEFSYYRLSERIESGYDHLEFYNIFINFNRIKSEIFTLYWGLGMKNLSGNSLQTAFGLNFGAEVFPVRPISVNLLYNVGFFKGASVDELNLNLKVHFNRFNVFVGYQKFRAGDIDFPGVTAGIGVYF
jgi:hypothetical protein